MTEKLLFLLFLFFSVNNLSYADQTAEGNCNIQIQGDNVKVTDIGCTFPKDRLRKKYRQLYDLGFHWILFARTINTPMKNSDVNPKTWLTMAETLQFTVSDLIDILEIPNTSFTLKVPTSEEEASRYRKEINRVTPFLVSAVRNRFGDTSTLAFQAGLHISLYVVLTSKELENKLSIEDLAKLKQASKKAKLKIVKLTKHINLGKVKLQPFFENPNTNHQTTRQIFLNAFVSLFSTDKTKN